MKFNTLLLFLISIVVIIALSLIIFLINMHISQRKIKKSNYPDCPDLVFYRYQLWCKSFALWTSIQYLFIILPVFTSMSTIYFTTDFIVENSRENIILLSIVSFLSASLPLLNSKLIPKTCADNFYKGAITLEQGIMKHKEKLITGFKEVHGNIVHSYLAMYIDKLFDGSIPYERMDWRILRLLWEHKTVMLERIQKTETIIGVRTISDEYKKLVSETNTLRMIYATHHMKRRDAVLPGISKKLLDIKDREEKLLTEFVEKVEGVI